GRARSVTHATANRYTAVMIASTTRAAARCTRSEADGAGDATLMGVLGLDLGAIAGPQGVEGPRPVDAPVGVCAEEVALTLHERGGEPLGAQPVVVRQRGGERRCRDAGGGRRRDDPPPRVLSAAERLDEVR